MIGFLQGVRSWLVRKKNYRLVMVILGVVGAVYLFTFLSVALRHERGMFSICFLYGGHGYGVQGGIAGARIE